MCGFAGVVSRGKKYKAEQVLKSFAAISHRGPDASGHWFNQDYSVGLTHTRLAIIDPGKQSDQPMVFLNRYTIVFNGEIYNYRELAKQISQNEGLVFKTGSDTEVLVASYHFYKEKCLDTFEGMFSFAIWDQEKNELFCARDRFGEKPFYYFQDTEQGLIFSNETRALHYMGVEKNIHQPLLLHYLAIGVTNLPGDPTATFFTGIKKLKPAHYLKFTLHSGELLEKCYWECPKKINKISFQEAKEEFERLLVASIKQRSYSDTPRGCSLSGGLDSSSITYFLHGSGIDPSCFSAVFPGEEIDEKDYIESVQNRFNLNVNYLSLSAGDLINDLDAMIYAHNHPIANPSSYAQFKVYKEAGKQGVKVLLDGQGADETLAGYSKYYHWIIQEKLKRNGPLKAFQLLDSLQKNGQPVEFDYKNIISTYFPVWTKKALEKRYLNQVSNCSFLKPEFKFDNLHRRDVMKPVVNSLNDILYHDSFNFGLDELLRYADLNSMAHGVEVRLPFLSRDLVEFEFSLHSDFKINSGYTKWILRKTMENKLPPKITWRKRKIGFEVPVTKWLDHPDIQKELSKGISTLVKNGILLNHTIKSNTTQLEQWRFLIAGKLLEQ